MTRRQRIGYWLRRSMNPSFPSGPAGPMGPAGCDGESVDFDEVVEAVIKRMKEELPHNEVRND